MPAAEETLAPGIEDRDQRVDQLLDKIGEHRTTTIAVGGFLLVLGIIFVSVASAYDFSSFSTFRLGIAAFVTAALAIMFFGGRWYLSSRQLRRERMKK